MRYWIVGALLLASAAPARAQAPLVTDRPDFTESAAAVAPGRVQLESGYTFTRAGEVDDHALGEVLVRVGLAPRLELRLGANSYRVSRGPAVDDEGFEDASLGAKLVLVEEAGRPGSARPAVALLAGTTLPTGADAYGADELEPEAILALAWTLSERAGLSSNVGWAYPRDEDERFGQLAGSVALGIALADRAGGYVEVYGFRPDRRDGPDAAYLNGGVTYLVSDDFQLDARVGAGLNDAATDFFFGVGVARRW